MIKLILVRHGESIANKKGIYQGQTYDTGLTLRGKKQAEMLIEPLGKIIIDGIITSPLQRTRQTAEILSQKLKIPVTVDKEIVEISHGRWEGHSKKWVEVNYPRLVKLWWKRPSRVQMPKGEDLDEVYRRVRKFLEQVANENFGKSILVVGHDLIMRVIIGIVIGLPQDNIWNFRLDNGGVTILKVEKGLDGQIIVLNQNYHLNKYLSDVDSQAL